MEIHYKSARAAGASDDEIREAIDIGETIKETVMMNSRILIDNLMDDLASDRGKDKSRSAGAKVD